MNKSKLILLPLMLLLALALSACGGGADEGASEAVLTEAAKIAISGLTQTAAAAPPTATTAPPSPTPTNTPEPSPTVEPTKDNSQAIIPSFTPAAAASSNAPCLRANFEYETIPDGTQYPVGKVFTKTWRLKNTGSCTWNSQTTFIWIQGDLMGAKSVTEFTDVDIPPNDYAEINVNFQTPSKPGIYKGYWMLRSSTGETFGVGIYGKAWVWVEINAFRPAD